MDIETKKHDELQSLWQHFSAQKQHGKISSIDEFVDEHPDREAEIRQFFPILAGLDEISDCNSELPETIANYRIVRQIGIGGMGIVYEAESDTLRERVAIKVVDSNYLAFGREKRFEKEARLVAGLHHSNIVPVYEFGEFEEHKYFTMKLIEGYNLAELLFKDLSDSGDCDINGGLARLLKFRSSLANNWPCQIDIIRQAAIAIQYAHQNGVLHRDIKPANLLLDKNEKIWVADFGLAKLVPEEHQTGSRSKVLGTPRYMAPEQLRGEADCRSDIFGLGLVMYELSLIQGCNPVFRHPIWKGGINPPSRFNNQIPPELESIILKAISLDPNDRQASMQEFISELDSIDTACQNSKYPNATSSYWPNRSATKIATICAFVTAIWFLVALFGFHIPENAGLRQASDNQNQAESVAFVREESSHAVEPTAKLDRNMAPTLSNQNFFDELNPTGRNEISLPAKRPYAPYLLKLLDDEDSRFDGLYCYISGGKDRNQFCLTPDGVISLIPSDTRDSIQSNRKFEIEISVKDRTRTFLMTLDRDDESNVYLTKNWIAGTGGIQHQQVCNKIQIAENVVDIASADGNIFFHLHENEHSYSLFKSSIDSNSGLTTELLTLDCSLGSGIIGFGTSDGKTFTILQSTGDGQRMMKAELDEQNKFRVVFSMQRLKTPKRLNGLGWIGSNRYEFLTQTENNHSKYYFSFWKKPRLCFMPLTSKPKDFERNPLGIASFVESLPGSRVTTKTVAIRFED